MEQTLSSESVPLFIGLDYQSKSAQACVLDAAGKILRNRRCGNSLAEVGNPAPPLPAQ